MHLNRAGEEQTRDPFGDLRAEEAEQLARVDKILHETAAHDRRAAARFRAGLGEQCPARGHARGDADESRGSVAVDRAIDN